MRQLKNHRAEKRGPDAKKYEGMSEPELMAELMKKVAAAKNDGSLSAGQLDDFVSFVTPDLDEAAAKRLRELVAMIKATI